MHMAATSLTTLPLVSHLVVFLHLRVTNLPGLDSIMCSTQAQQRRVERAAGKNDRMRLRKRLAQQSTPNPPATQCQSSSAPNDTPTRPLHSASTAQTRKLHASSTDRPIGSKPERS